MHTLKISNRQTFFFLFFFFYNNNKAYTGLPVVRVTESEGTELCGIRNP